MAESERKAPWDFEAVRPDVAVLVALKEELHSLANEYAQQWFPRRNPKHPGSDFLFLGPGGYRCVATIMPRMGPTMASTVSMRLLGWEPAVIINVGIAGGLKDELRIGDVIVPRQVDAYDETGKLKDAVKSKPRTASKAPRWERRGSSYRPTATIVADVQELELVNPQAHAAWVKAGAAQLERVRSSGDRLHLDALLEGKLLRREPIVSTSHLASGSFVVASKPFAEFIRAANADIHAGEMEAGGMLLAAEYLRDDVRTLVVRGISDHVDADKSEVDAIGGGALRRLAMDNAWRMVCTLMELGLLPRAERRQRSGRKTAAKPKATTSRVDRKPKADAAETTKKITKKITKIDGDPSSIPAEPPRGPLDDHELADVLADLFVDEKIAKQLLSRVRFPRRQLPRFDRPSTFWFEVVGLLRDGIVKGDGVQRLVDEAAQQRPGHVDLARHATKPAASAEPGDAPPPERQAEAHPALDSTVVGKIVDHLRAHAPLVERLATGQDAWRSAAREGHDKLVRALGATDPVALVTWVRTEIERTPRIPSAKGEADSMLDLLDLVLPVVADPFLRASTGGPPQAAYPLTVETIRARADGRSVELRERHAKDPKPRALVDIDPKRRVKTSAHMSGGLTDMVKRIQEQHEELALVDPHGVGLLDAVMEVLRVADVAATTTVDDMPPDEKLEYAKVSLPMIRGRGGQPMTLYVIAPRRRTGEPIDRFVQLLAKVLQGLHVVEPPERADLRETRLLAALGQLYVAYRNLLEDLTR